MLPPPGRSTALPGIGAIWRCEKQKSFLVPPFSRLYLCSFRWSGWPGQQALRQERWPDWHFYSSKSSFWGRNGNWNPQMHKPFYSLLHVAAFDVCFISAFIFCLQALLLPGFNRWVHELESLQIRTHSLPKELPLISAHIYHFQVFYVSILNTAFNLSQFNTL